MQRRTLMLGGAVTVAIPRFLCAATPTLGVTLPLSGVQAEVAKELEIGYRMAAAEAGIAIKVLDDESSPEKVAANIKRLGSDPSVVALSGIVGTPHAQAGLAAAKAADLPVVGIRSGAQFLRTGSPSVFHLRASYEDELDKMVEYCRGLGIQQMAIMYSDDSFGTSSRDHLISRLKAAGIKVASSVGVERNGGNMTDASRQTAEAVRDGLSAVALLLIVKPMVAAAKELRITHSIALPILAMSFTITGNVATTTDKALSGLGLVSAFPLPRAGADIRRLYREALTRDNKPAVLTQSVTAYEGYFYGTVVGRVISQSGGNRDLVNKKLMSGMTFGGMTLDFSKGNVGYHYLEFLHKARDGLLRT